MFRRLLMSIGVGALFAFVPLAMPAEAAAQCFVCTDCGGGCFKCDTTASGGWEDCEVADSGCLLNGQCMTFASHELPNGDTVRGEAISADAFAVRLCNGEQLAVLYSDEGAAVRQREASRIVFTESS